MNRSHTHNIFVHWLICHYRALRMSINELKESPLINIVTICMIGIAIVLPLGFFIVLENLQLVNNNWNTTAPSISLYLKNDISTTEVDAFLQDLQKNHQISKVTYISPQEGLKTFKKNTPFADALTLFQHNPIPGVITVLPKKQDNPLAIHSLFLSLKQSSLVDIAQLDMNWVNRLYEAIIIGKKITNALAVLFGFGVILIISHTLRASLISHMKEIQVLKLMGATNGYIRRPLLYRGIFYGVLGGAFAWILIDGFLYQLQTPISQLAMTYHATFHLESIAFYTGSWVLLFSGALGFISAWLITTQFLNNPEQMD